MTDTTLPATLAEALAQLQADLPDVRKDAEANVGTYSYAYADLADCTNAIMPKLAAVGLSFSTRPMLVADRFVLRYSLRHISGQQTSGDYPLPDPGKANAQQLGSAITYARRYALCAVTGLAPDKDDDAQAAQPKPAKQQHQTRPANTPTVQMSRNGGQAHNGQDPDVITPYQLKKLHACFNHVGITERQSRLDYARDELGREIGSSKDLTKSEATRLIDHLAGLLEPAPEEVPSDG